MNFPRRPAASSEDWAADYVSNAAISASCTLVAAHAASRQILLEPRVQEIDSLLPDEDVRMCLCRCPCHRASRSNLVLNFSNMYVIFQLLP